MRNKTMTGLRAKGVGCVQRVWLACKGCGLRAKGVGCETIEILNFPNVPSPIITTSNYVHVLQTIQTLFVPLQ